MALKFLPEHVLLLKVDRFKGFLNRSKIDRMVNDHWSSCSLLGFKNVYKNIA